MAHVSTQAAEATAPKRTLARRFQLRSPSVSRDQTTVGFTVYLWSKHSQLCLVNAGLINGTLANQTVPEIWAKELNVKAEEVGTCIIAQTRALDVGVLEALDTPSIGLASCKEPENSEGQTLAIRVRRIRVIVLKPRSKEREVQFRHSVDCRLYSRGPNKLGCMQKSLLLSASMAAEVSANDKPDAHLADSFGVPFWFGSHQTHQITHFLRSWSQCRPHGSMETTPLALRGSGLIMSKITPRKFERERDINPTRWRYILCRNLMELVTICSAPFRPSELAQPGIGWHIAPAPQSAKSRPPKGRQLETNTCRFSAEIWPPFLAKNGGAQKKQPRIMNHLGPGNCCFFLAHWFTKKTKKTKNFTWPRATDNPFWKVANTKPGGQGHMTSLLPGSY